MFYWNRIYRYKYVNVGPISMIFFTFVNAKRWEHTTVFCVFPCVFCMKWRLRIVIWGRIVVVKSSDGSNRSIDRLGLWAGFLFRITPFVWGNIIKCAENTIILFFFRLLSSFHLTTQASYIICIVKHG